MACLWMPISSSMCASFPIRILFQSFARRRAKIRKLPPTSRKFPQTKEFLGKVTDLMLYLLPHYVEEGKSYLTVAFGCTGGQHRSVMMAEEMSKRLRKAGYQVKAVHRDIPR